tara:strand:- start:758 stop:880 length:123 start_codon:yes stop_codon:yes gene_type:complete
MEAFGDFNNDQNEKVKRRKHSSHRKKGGRKNVNLCLILLN